MIRFVAIAVGVLALSACDSGVPVAQTPDCTAGANAEARTAAPGWTLLGLQGDGVGPVNVVAVHPDDPDFLLVGTGADFSAGIPDRLYRSEDGGETWSQAYQDGIYGGGVGQIAFDPHDPDVVYAVPGALLKSTDRGQTWSDVSEGLPVNFDTRVQTVALDPNVPGRVYAGAAGFFPGGFFRSDDGGATWTEPTDGLCTGDGGVYCDLSNGPIELAVGPEGTIYAGINGSGSILTSGDGGQAWSYALQYGGGYKGLPGSLLVDRDVPSTVYAQIGSGSLGTASFIESHDGGETWAAADEGLPVPLNSGALVQSPRDGTLFLTGSLGGEVGSVWRRGPGDEVWVDVGPEEPLVVYRGLAISAERGLLYGGGDGLWVTPLSVGTGTEGGPCQP